MVHRAMLVGQQLFSRLALELLLNCITCDLNPQGSVERMFAILTEHFGGNWPLWLSPRYAVPSFSPLWPALIFHQWHTVQASKGYPAPPNGLRLQPVGWCLIFWIDRKKLVAQLVV